MNPLHHRTRRPRESLPIAVLDTRGKGYEREREFAEAIRRSLPADGPAVEAAARVLPFQASLDAGGSTDVADVSWVVPTAGLEAATWVPGTAAFLAGHRRRRNEHR